MNTPDTKAVCRCYLEMCLADWHKTDLALKALDAIVSGGKKQDELRQLFSDIDSGAILRAAAFRSGGGLQAAIRRISD